MKKKHTNRIFDMGGGGGSSLISAMSNDYSALLLLWYYFTLRTLHGFFLFEEHFKSLPTISAIPARALAKPFFQCSAVELTATLRFSSSLLVGLSVKRSAFTIRKPC